MTRPSLDEYFMDMCELVSRRSTCMRRTVGAVIVKDKHVLATGYNGAPMGLLHCDMVGCIREQNHIPSGERQELCRAVHAEANAITQAAYFGVSINGASMYTTFLPCVSCTKMIINSGIKEVIYLNEYTDELAKQMMEESNIILRKFVLDDKRKVVIDKC